MPLPRAQWKPFADALRQAFPTRGDLERMVFYGLGATLDEIAGGGPLPNAVLDVIRWADAQGRLDDLLQAACDNNPGNPALRVFGTAAPAPAAPLPIADPAREDARQRQALLDGYLDQIGSLLLTTPLQSGALDAAEAQSARALARARTLALLPRLTGPQKGVVLQFLYAAGLITGDPARVDLRGADLSGAALSDRTDLSRVSLPETNLSKAYLAQAYLGEADLRQAYLGGADLRRADLGGTLLGGANLRGADLSGAGLTGAFVEAARLMGVGSLAGATLPNGTRYTGPDQPTNEADLGPRDPANPALLARVPVPSDEAPG